MDLVVLLKIAYRSRQVSKSLGFGTKMTQICHKSFLPMSALHHTAQKFAAACDSIFTELYRLARDLAACYVKTAERDSFEQAIHELQDIYNQLRIEDLNLCGSNEELFEAAKRFAAKCQTARDRSESASADYPKN